MIRKISVSREDWRGDYIGFILDEDRSQNRVTNWWNVRALDGTILGVVKWTSRWRRYAFFPEPNTMFEGECLFDITQFVNAMTTNRKLERKCARSSDPSIQSSVANLET